MHSICISLIQVPLKWLFFSLLVNLQCVVHVVVHQIVAVLHHITVTPGQSHTTITFDLETHKIINSWDYV